MKKGFVFALVVPALSLVACVGAKVGAASSVAISKGIWQYAPLTIDGNDSDWTDPLLFNDEEGAISYSITNDERNFYVVLKTAEKTVQAKILYNGIALRLSAEKENRNRFTLQYPLPGEAAGSGAAESNPVAKEHRISNADIYEVTGSKAGNGLHFCSGPAGPLQVQLSMNHKRELVYEVQVPFSLFYKEALSPADRDKPLYCELAIAGFAKNSVSFANLVRRYNANKPATVAYKERESFASSTRIKKAVPLATR